MRLRSWPGARLLLPLLLLQAVLHVSADGKPKERHYYIAAVEIDWNYSGNVEDRFTYKKVVFREYEKGFRQAKAHPPWLGLLGPTLRAELGETIVVTFRNMASRPHSIHPHGIAYGKQSEGAHYFDNTSQKEKEDDLVQPNGEHVYYWEVTSEVAPQLNDSTCLTYMYISHRNVVEEYNSGLVGTLLLCKNGSLDAMGQQKGVDQEFVFLYGIFDEKVSETVPKGYPLDNHVKYTINGYTKGALPGITLCAHSFVSFHLLGMSSEPELFSVHLSGHVLQQMGNKVSSVGLISGSTATASVVPAYTGRWLLSSYINKHMEVGMHAFVDVKKCDGFPPPPRRLTIAQKRESTEWTYFIAAEEVLWDYAPNPPKHIDKSFEAQYLTRTATRIGQVYKKVVYTLYKNESFTERLESKQRRSELGIVGPVIRAQVRDVIKIVFKNKASRPYSIYPHGLTIEKSDEGVKYPAGGNHTHGVEPGETHTYFWRVIEEDRPLDGDSRCLTRMYHSAVDAPRDIASGLIGPILICKSQSLNKKNVQVRADKEQHAMFAVFDENKSWYFDENIRMFADPSRVNKEDPEFYKSNVMHTINGYVYESGPLLGFCYGEVVTWHVSSIGAQDYIQTATFYGHPFEVNGRTEDFLNLYPMTGETIAMNMENIGVWLVSSLNSHESTKGMRVKFQDVECFRENQYEYEDGDEPKFDVWEPPTSEEIATKEDKAVVTNPVKTEEDIYTDMYADLLGIRSHKNKSRDSDVEKLDLSMLDYDFIDVVVEDPDPTTTLTAGDLIPSPRNNSSNGAGLNGSKMHGRRNARMTNEEITSRTLAIQELTRVTISTEQTTNQTKGPTNLTLPTQGPTNLTLPTQEPTNLTLPTQEPTNLTLPTQEPTNLTLPTQGLTNLTLPTQGPTNLTLPTQGPTNLTLPTQEPTNLTFPTQEPTNLTLPTQGLTNLTLPTQGLTNLTLPTQGPTNLTLPTQGLTNLTLPTQDLTNLTLPTQGQTYPTQEPINQTLPTQESTNLTLPTQEPINLTLPTQRQTNPTQEPINQTLPTQGLTNLTLPTQGPTNHTQVLMNLTLSSQKPAIKHTMEHTDGKYTRGDVFTNEGSSSTEDRVSTIDDGASDMSDSQDVNVTRVKNGERYTVNKTEFDTSLKLTPSLNRLKSNYSLVEESNSLEDDAYFTEELSTENVSNSSDGLDHSISEEDSFSESTEEVIIYLKENQTEVIKTTSVNVKDHSWTYTGTHLTVPMTVPEDMIKYLGNKTSGAPTKKRKIKKINLRQWPLKGLGMKTKKKKEYKPQVRNGLPFSPRGFNPIMSPRGSRPLSTQPVLDNEELLNLPLVIGVPRPDFSDYEIYIPGEEPDHLDMDLNNVNEDEYEYVSYKDPYSSQEDIKGFSLDETTTYLLQGSGPNDKTYYISAEEVEWDYAGYGQRRQDKSDSLNGRETTFTKVVFRGYLDSNFRSPDIRGEMDEHLGILGPVIKAEVDQTIRVVFKNNANRPFSIHPNGVSYTKRTEGLSYEDGSKYWHQYDNEVRPNTTFTYVWTVNSKVGPSSNESDCRTWAYYSGVNPEKDIHSGLIGPLLVCRKGTLDKQVTDTREFTLLFMTFDESQSWYHDMNYERIRRKSRRKMRDFHGENLKFHSINGIIHNLKGLRMYTNQLVSWHLINMGSPKDFQSVHFHGQTFIHKKTTSYRQAVYPLLPGSFATLEMYPSKPGLWQLESEIGFNQQKGMQTLFLVLDNECYRPLGLELGSVNDEQITAINTRGYWEPRLARLNNPGKYNAWSTEQNHSWIQVDFQRPVVISQVATQGAKQMFQSQYVVKYFISYSNDRRKWIYYKGDGHHLRKVFKGNQEAYETKTNTFFPPLIGRFIRLHPIEWYNKATVRMEFYGCELDGCSVPLGMESRRIEDHRITASSTASNWNWESWKPSLARLNKKGTVNAWQARYNDQNQWLQVELPEIKKITGIITQGAKSLMKEMYVISYTLQYSNDGLHWSHYTDDDGNLPKVFRGNTDNNEHAKNYIYPPIFSRFIRINPTSWMVSITMRIELLGCDFE
ncbi:coagulation factor V [Neosynchiropus ocellatus]